MWKDKLEDIKTEKQRYNERLNVGATEDELRLFSVELNKVLGIEIPHEYETFLCLINGFEFNGFILYGIDSYITNRTSNQSITGLLESNQILYDNPDQKKYIFLGESNISWYVFNVDDNNYMIIDNPSGSVISIFENLPQLLETIFTDVLL